MAQLIKGSPEAQAWAKKMKKARIRAAGLRTERQFFGPGGEFEDEAMAKARTNPKRPHGKFRSCVKKVSAKPLPVGSDPKKICGAVLNPRPEPHFTSWQMLVDYLKQEGWKPLGKKGVASFGRTIQGLYQILQLEARAWRVLYQTDLIVRSFGTYKTLDRALIAANRQANDYLFPKTRRANPITLNGNPPKRIRSDVAGIMYNRVWEIQAEKTGDKHKGFWYHPFKTGSDVQMLALDTGDILIHSKAGKKLWRPD